MRKGVSSGVAGFVLAALAAALLPLSPATAADTPLAWTACTRESLAAGGYECARLEVPMDRRHPDAGTFSLPLVRHRATGPATDRIGSLVFNPGGPGGAGLDAMDVIWSRFMPEPIKQRFDLVTWDPRGVGESVPSLSGCVTPWPERPDTGPVDWADVVARFRVDLAAANRACQAKNSRLVEHMSTVENVQDLDRIRAALGDEKLTFWGMSYGTRIGYVYAKTFPQHVRAIVLDGSIDPASTTLGLAEGGAAPDQAFGSWADAYPTSAAQLAALLSTLNRRTFTLSDGTSLTRWIVKDIVYNAVAQQSSYDGIATVVSTLYNAVLGTEAQRSQAASAAVGLANFQRSTPNSNAGGVFSVVNCLDYPGRPGGAAITRAVLDEVRNAPAYGGSLATMYASGCSGLTLRPDPVPLITGDGPRVPVLILGATRDGSTIQTWTGRMSRAFPMSRTVTYAGGQHVTWGLAGSACVNDVANAYVTTLTLPPMDVGCSNVIVPQG